ncbi:MAG: hypothetical protein ACTSYV_01485 [Candidatus Heimdallarchaeaceae archaeon]
MKIRGSFVSNSSSASFIIGLPSRDLNFKIGLNFSDVLELCWLPIPIKREFFSSLEKFESRLSEGNLTHLMLYPNPYCKTEKDDIEFIREKLKNNEVVLVVHVGESAGLDFARVIEQSDLPEQSYRIIKG